MTRGQGRTFPPSGAIMTDDLEGLVTPCQESAAIERLMDQIRALDATVSAQKARIHAMQGVLHRWYVSGDLRPQTGERDQAFTARYLALKNATVAQLHDWRGEASS